MFCFPKKAIKEDNNYGFCGHEGVPTSEKEICDLKIEENLEPEDLIMEGDTSEN